MDRTRRAILKQGFLVKSPPQDKIGAQWRRRFFVLWSTGLMEYYSSQDKRPQDYLKTIDLNQFETIDAPYHIGSREHVIRVAIRTPGGKQRDYFFDCEACSEMNEWLVCLRQVCRSNSDPWSPPPVPSTPPPQRRKSAISFPTNSQYRNRTLPPIPPEAQAHSHAQPFTVAPEDPPHNPFFPQHFRRSHSQEQLDQYDTFDDEELLGPTDCYEEIDEVIMTRLRGMSELPPVWKPGIGLMEAPPIIPARPAQRREEPGPSTHISRSGSDTCLARRPSKYFHLAHASKKAKKLLHSLVKHKTKKKEAPPRLPPKSSVSSDSDDGYERQGVAEEEDNHEPMDYEDSFVQESPVLKRKPLPDVPHARTKSKHSPLNITNLARDPNFGRQLQERRTQAYGDIAQDASDPEDEYDEIADRKGFATANRNKQAPPPVLTHPRVKHSSSFNSSPPPTGYVKMSRSSPLSPPLPRSRKPPADPPEWNQKPPEIPPRSAGPGSPHDHFLSPPPPLPSRSLSSHSLNSLPPPIPMRHAYPQEDEEEEEEEGVPEEEEEEEDVPPPVPRRNRRASSDLPPAIPPRMASVRRGDNDWSTPLPTKPARENRALPTPPPSRRDLPPLPNKEPPPTSRRDLPPLPNKEPPPTSRRDLPPLPSKEPAPTSRRDLPPLPNREPPPTSRQEMAPPELSPSARRQKFPVPNSSSEREFPRKGVTEVRKKELPPTPIAALGRGSPRDNKPPHSWRKEPARVPQDSSGKSKPLPVPPQRKEPDSPTHDNNLVSNMRLAFENRDSVASQKPSPGNQKPPAPSPGNPKPPAPFPEKKNVSAQFSGNHKPPSPLQKSPTPTPGQKSHFSTPGSPVPTPGYQRPPVSTPGYQKPPVSTPGYQKPPVSTPGYPKPPVSTPGYPKPPVSTPGYQKPPAPIPGGHKLPVPTPGSQKPNVPIPDSSGRKKGPPPPVRGKPSSPSHQSQPNGVSSKPVGGGGHSDRRGSPVILPKQGKPRPLLPPSYGSGKPPHRQ